MAHNAPRNESLTYRDLDFGVHSHNELHPSNFLSNPSIFREDGGYQNKDSLNPLPQILSMEVTLIPPIGRPKTRLPYA